MKYKILYDKNGRLRVRAGKYAFNKNQGYYLEEIISKFDFVQEVKSDSANGALTIRYTSDGRGELIDFLSNVKKSELAERDAKGEILQRELSSDYKFKIAILLCRRILAKLFLPVSLMKSVVILKSIPFLYDALKSIWNGRMNVELLDGASIGASMLYKDYSTASSIIFLLNISTILEEYIKKHTKNALSISLEMNIDKVWLKTEDSEVLVGFDEIKKGDIVHIYAGNMIPVDGKVVQSEAMVNESSMTGESSEIRKYKGLSVYAGTVVVEGDLFIKVNELVKGSRIGRIVEMIDNSEKLKSSTQSRAEKLADDIVPYSFLTFFSVLILTRNINKALSVLMVDYSCAIKLSIPISIITAMRDGANNQIIIKGGRHLEEFNNADTLVFDKTGTLTKAKPRVSKVIPIENYSRKEVLKISACLEEHFPHSIANAIVKQAEIENIIHKEEHTEVNYIVAHGISSTLHGQRVLIGSYHFIFEDEQIEFTEEIERIVLEELQGQSVIYLVVGDKVAGIIGIEDELREEARDVIFELKNLGIKNIIMMTGDNKENAKKISGELGIEEFYYEVMPEEKSEMIRKLKAEGRKVIMVGDGVNDSPALAEANVSVAMSDASDIAREISDITLVNDDLQGLVKLRHLSKSLFNRINLSYNFILSFNTSIIILGALGLLNPNLAAISHNGSTMILTSLCMLPYNNDK